MGQRVGASPQTDKMRVYNLMKNNRKKPGVGSPLCGLARAGAHALQLAKA
jgi:hypothetical protein